jgi:hypothetical protein
VQVQQRRLQGRDGVHGGAQVERLQAAPSRVAVGERGGHGAQQAAVPGHRLPDDEPPRLLDRRPDLLPAGHLAQPGAAVGVGDYRDVPREERGVRAGQVEQHRVVARDGHHLDTGDRGVGAH